ncbi:hypothetical protein HMPREF9093_01619 [Fusobacterium sp. oral taxon 370 str. F0437]|nr:hypothetical protein [Fusobacterium sp. oral taxon 370]EHI78094.1 hypothetical protein HMPREF9093_01619 [Fusobacterium sp. oral taxon 370 str. F0437]
MQQKTIKAKLIELRKSNLVIPEAKKMKDVSSTLNEGEFSTYVPVKENFDFKATINNLKDQESFKKGTEDLKNKANELTDNIPKGYENLFGIIGGVISIINTFLFAIFSVKVPFFGDYSIGFFKGLGVLADFSKEAKNAQAILLFSGILFVALAGLLIYSSIIKNKNILLYSIIGNAIFLVIFYVILFIKLPGGEVGKYISVSFFKILLYLISFTLAFVSYFLLNKIEENEVGETTKTIETTIPIETSLNNGDDKNEEGL